MKSSFVLLKKKKYSKYKKMDVNNSLELKKKKEKNSMGVIKFYNQEMINSVVQKNITNQFKKLLDYIISCEEDDDPNSLLLALNETEKFKREMINKYEKYLDKKKMAFNKKKIDLIIEDLKRKLVTYRIMHTMILKEEVEEEKHRSR